MKHLPILALILALPSLAWADPGFRLAAPADWTAEPSDAPVTDVEVAVWFVDEADVVTQASPFIGPLLQGEIRPIDTSMWSGTGQRVCVNASAQRANVPSSKVLAVPSCATFPFYAIIPPSILLTP